MHNKPIEEKESNELSWMKSFIPSNSLKLSINAKVKYDIANKDDTLTKINDLVFFRSLFYEVGDIIAEINIETWR